MEFIEGESLDRVLARTGALEPRFAMKVLASLLDALAAVHRTGVVHRDVKPANVMLTSGGVVLADFGIARSPESLGLTAADALMGTVPYLAPELFHAETPTPAADVYAVGILGYELLSGRQPFQAASTAAVMYMHMHEPPPPLPDYVAAPVAEVLWHALEKDPAHRWADGAEMAEAVRHVLAGPVEAGEDLARRARPGRPLRRLRRDTERLRGHPDRLRRPPAPAARGRAEAATRQPGVLPRPPRPAGYAATPAPEGRYGQPTARSGTAYAASGLAAGGPAREGPRHSRALSEALRPHQRAEDFADAPAQRRPHHTGDRPRRTVRGPDATRAYDQRMTPMTESGGRRCHAADSPDATRVSTSSPARWPTPAAGTPAGPRPTTPPQSLRSAAGARPSPTTARPPASGAVAAVCAPTCAARRSSPPRSPYRRCWGCPWRWR